MTKGIYDAKYNVLMAFVQYGVDMAMRGETKDICKMLDNGVMSSNEFIDEIVMELIRYAYDKKGEKGSLRSHLMQNGMGNDDSKKAAYGRIREYAQKYRDREAQRRAELLGEAPDGLEGMPMKNIKDKLSGYEYNAMQFFELTQMQEVRIFKSFVEHRLEDTNKVNNTKFKELFEEYEEFVDGLRLTDDMSDEEVVFNSLAYWVVQWKYPLELFYAIALHEEEHEGACENREQISLLCADLTIQRPQGMVSTHSRFIKVRNNMISKLLYDTEEMSLDVEFDSFTLQEYIFLKSQIMQNYCADAETLYYLKDWFVKETTIADWADFLREYNIFSVHQKKEWTPKRIRIVRALIKKMTIK